MTTPFTTSSAPIPVVVINWATSTPVPVSGPIAVTGTFWQATQPVSGTITANAGTNLNTSLLALDSSVTALSVAQDSVSAGERGVLCLAAVVTAAPSLITGHTSALSTDPTGNLRVTTVDGGKAAYGVVGLDFAPAATPTDIVTITGSNSKTVRIKQITLSALATTAGTMDGVLIKRTTVDTGGASTSPSIAQYDSNDPSPTAVVTQYSSNPASLGTGVSIRAIKINFGLKGSATTTSFQFSTRNDKACILRGTSQQLAINLNGAALPVGGTFTYELEWEEDNS